MNKRTDILFVSLTLLLSTPVSAHVLSFIDRDFNAFVNHIVPPSQRDNFDSYYQKINTRIKEKDGTEGPRLRGNLYQTALTTLQVEHRAWAHDITTFLTDMRYLDSAFDAERAEVRNFLYWYGAYEAFQAACHTKKVAHIESKKFIDTVRVQVAKVTHKIGDWFKSLKTKLT